MEDVYEFLLQAKGELAAAISAIDTFIEEQSAVEKQHRVAATVCVNGAKRIRRALGDEVEEQPNQAQEKTGRQRVRDSAVAGEAHPAAQEERARRARTRSRESAGDNVDDDEVVVSSARKSRRKKSVVEAAAVEGEETRRTSGKLKSGGIARGPSHELVFYSPNVKRQAFVDCDVYGMDASRSYERVSLSPCSFEELEQKQQKWVCLKLCEVIEDTIVQSVVTDPFQCFLKVHKLLNSTGRVLLAEGGSVKQQRNDDLFCHLRGVQRALVNADTCRKAMCYMVAAKLSSEVKEAVDHGQFSAVFDERLEQVRELYDLKDVKVSTLKRYLPAGRLMLQCHGLAFVNITLLVDQQKVIEEILRDEELRPRLLTGVVQLDKPAAPLTPNAFFAFDKLEDYGAHFSENGFDFNRSPADLVPHESALVNRLNSLMERLCDAVNALQEHQITEQLSALDFAKILRMDFANHLMTEPLNLGPVDAGQIRLYMSLVNASLSSSGMRGFCVLDPCAPVDLDIPDLDWLAVAISSVGVGAVFNLRTHSVVVYVYNKSLFNHIARKHVEATRCCLMAGFNWDFVAIDEFDTGLGMLHFLSCVVWRRDASDFFESNPVPISAEMLRLQVASELYDGRLGNQGESFLARIVREQPPLLLNIPECEYNLIPALIMHTGFVVVRRFFSMENLHDACAQLISLVKAAPELEPIFQSVAGHNDNKRLQVAVDRLPLSENVPAAALISVVQRRLLESVQRRKIWNMVALFSRAGCEPQRPHTDYTHYDLDDLVDDGFCGGLPLGVVVGLMSNTLFDAWPGARIWQHTRFYEHAQVILGAGDALFFLGDAVHAGAAFVEENCRIHAYLESRKQHDNREPDRTRFVDVGAGVATILPRNVLTTEL